MRVKRCILAGNEKAVESSAFHSRLHRSQLRLARKAEHAVKTQHMQLQHATNMFLLQQMFRGVSSHHISRLPKNKCIYIYVHMCIYIYIPRPSRCAFFLPFAEKAIYCVVCSKKSLFLLKVLLQNLAKTWSANVAFWSGNVAFGSGNVAFSSSSWFRKTAKYAKMR